MSLPETRPNRRFVRGGALSAIVAVCSLALAGCFGQSEPTYRGPPSDHFDGERFYNPGRPWKPGALDLLAWKLTDDPGRWYPDVDADAGPAPPARVADGTLRVTWVGHATLLVQMSGLNLLTDPVWSDTIGPVSTGGPKRVRPPGIRFEDLPPIDGILLSHNHYDHLDMPTVRRLVEAHDVPVYAGLGSGPYFEAEGLPASVDLDWWESIALADSITLTAVPAMHRSRRGFSDEGYALWLGWVVDDGHGAVYFAGDTAWGDHFGEIRRRFDGVRLALLPIGAYKPQWFMRSQHISPREAVDAAVTLDAEVSIGMHYATFRLADDGHWEPVLDLERALALHPSPPVFHVVDFGVGVEIP